MFYGRKQPVLWDMMSYEEQQDALKAEEIAAQAPKPAAMSDELYGFWLALASFLFRLITGDSEESDFDYEARKPGSPLHDEERGDNDHGHIRRLIRSQRGYRPETICAVALYLLELGESPPKYYDVKVHLVVRKPWLAYTTGPKGRKGALKHLPFVRERATLQADFRQALIELLGLPEANRILRIRTPPPPRKPRKSRGGAAWTREAQLRSMAESLQARLRTLALQSTGLLGDLEGLVAAKSAQPLPQNAQDLEVWHVEAQHLMDLAHARAEAERANQRADQAEQRAGERFRAEEVARQAVEREREQQAREEERRRLMTEALRLLRQRAPESGIPQSEWPPEVPALWQAMPQDRGAVSSPTTDDDLERLRTALATAQDAWDRFLNRRHQEMLARLEEKFGGRFRRRPRDKK